MLNCVATGIICAFMLSGCGGYGKGGVSGEGIKASPAPTQAAHSPFHQDEPHDIHRRFPWNLQVFCPHILPSEEQDKASYFHFFPHWLGAMFDDLLVKDESRMNSKSSVGRGCFVPDAVAAYPSRIPPERSFAENFNPPSSALPVTAYL